MSKTSRIILWCVLIAVLAMCIALYIAAKRPIEDTAYRNAGKTYAESQQPGDETPGITDRKERRVGKECRSRWSPYH